ncbi:MAG TPA: hypothetical protein VN808_16245 [Stellaceae bacterium]|nr:hypothetical protein [Stellaceae bacterium]
MEKSVFQRDGLGLNIAVFSSRDGEVFPGYYDRRRCWHLYGSASLVPAEDDDWIKPIRPPLPAVSLGVGDVMAI